MSHLAGVLHLDGAPFASSELPIFSTPAGADDTGVCVEGPFGARWSVRWSTREAVRERQPLYSDDRRFLISYVGRLDNRDEVARGLGCDRDATDGELLLATLVSRGPDGLRDCVGDFALAVWDRVDRRLWIARDAIGQRPLYFAVDSGRCVWSSDIGYLVQRCPGSRRPNEGLIAELLIDRPTSQCETAYAGIHRLPGAHFATVQIGDDRVSVVEYWRPSATPTVGGETDLIAALRERLHVAVRACVRSQGSVGADLSGGLDSSTVYALAANELGVAPTAYSMSFPGEPADASGSPVDEARFFGEMIRAARGTGRVIYPLTLGHDDFVRVLDQHHVPPDPPNGAPARFALLAASAADGHRVHLTGLGGDTWLTGSYRRLAVLLRRGQWGRARQFLRDASGPAGIGDRGALLRAAAIDLLPRFVRPALRQLRGTSLDVPPWLRRSFATRVGLAERVRAWPAWLATIDDPVLRGEVTRVYDVEQAWSRESAATAASDAGIDVRHPLLDRRLVEFLIGLPDEMRLRDGRTRFILRAAMRDVLPAKIRDRADKGNMDVTYRRALPLLLEGLSLDSIHLADLGWIDGGQLRRACAEFRQAARPDLLSGIGKTWLWHALAVELWLRSLDDA